MDRKRKRCVDAVAWMGKGHSMNQASKEFHVSKKCIKDHMIGAEVASVGRPSVLNKEEVEDLDLFFVSLETTTKTQMTLKETQKLLRKMSSTAKVSRRTTERYIKKTKAKLNTARKSDGGRVEAMDDVTRFVRFLDVWEECLNLVASDARRIFNADEVGVQLADHKVRLVTGVKYLNKEMANVNIHTTVTICTCADGTSMPPCFLFSDEYVKKNQEKDQRKDQRKEKEKEKEKGNGKEEADSETEEEKKKEKKKQEKGKKKKEDEDRRNQKEKLLMEGPKNMLCGLENQEASYMWNSSAYQDDDTWLHWIELFALYKNKKFDELCMDKNKPVILLVDGHGSHLSVKALYTAAKNRIIIVCLPSHTTSVLQPNDRTTNKKFKAQLRDVFGQLVAKNVIVTNYDVAWLCVSALTFENGVPMTDANLTSWRETGISPLDRELVMKELKKYQVKVGKKKEQKKLEILAGLIQDEELKRLSLIDLQEKRREESANICFGTKQVRVLTTPESIARLRLCKEWIKVKKMLRDVLKAQMLEWKIIKEEDMKGKTVPELKELAMNWLLEEEKKLTEMYEEELKSVQYDIPKNIGSFFIRKKPLNLSSHLSNLLPPLQFPISTFMPIFFTITPLYFFGGEIPKTSELLACEMLSELKKEFFNQ
jgi:hypothetical protein